MIRYREILGKKLRLLREIYSETHSENLTQEQLGIILGYKSNSAISLIECGRRGMLQDKIVQAAKVLGVNPIVLLSDRDMSKDELECCVYWKKR